MALWVWIVTLLFVTGIIATHHWDENGYVFFCLCMGRFGNQADHFLGGLSFTKAVNRTLVLPAFRTYKNIPFNEWFKVEPLEEYHRVILAEDFMAELASEHWPVGKRTGFCYAPRGGTCEMKNGNPFTNFWDEYGVDFDEIHPLQAYYADTQNFMDVYPPEKYPVLAMRGAPAVFPVAEKDVPLQKYIQWSDKIQDEIDHHIQKLFNNDLYVGIHLRNGADWERACEHAKDQIRYMASPQCLGYKNYEKLPANLCYPSTTEVLRLTKKVVEETKVKHLFIATDQRNLMNELRGVLGSEINIVHLDPHLPIIDIGILQKSEHFIGNCVSSFTASVTRDRLVKEKPTSFWGYS